MGHSNELMKAPHLLMGHHLLEHGRPHTEHVHLRYCKLLCMTVIHDVKHLLHPVLPLDQTAFLLDYIETPERKEYGHLHPHGCGCSRDHKGCDGLVPIAA